MESKEQQMSDVNHQNGVVGGKRKLEKEEKIDSNKSSKTEEKSCASLSASNGTQLASHNGSGVCVVSIGTAKPRTEDGTPLSASTEDFLRWQESFLKCDLKNAKDESEKGCLNKNFALLKRLCENSGIERRAYSCSEIINPEVCPQLYKETPDNFSRAKKWENIAPRMAVEAAKQAIDEAGLVSQPESITHVITHSCTGWKAPGLSFDIIEKLKLSTKTRRVEVNFMGCFGASTALYTAKNTILAEPNAIVLVVCAELCTLHITRETKPEKMIGNCLFADGAAATILTSQSTLADLRKSRQSSSSSISTGGSQSLPSNIIDVLPSFELCSLGSMVVPGCHNAMLWEQGVNNYDILLSKDVPKHLLKFLKEEAHALPELCGLKSTDLNDIAFCIHPGGRAILDTFKSVASKIGVEPKSLESSYKILKEHGNMSSPTILFVLKDLLQNTLKDEILFLVFGPGLTVEYGGLRRC